MGMGMGMGTGDGGWGREGGRGKLGDIHVDMPSFFFVEQHFRPTTRPSRRWR